MTIAHVQGVDATNNSNTSIAATLSAAVGSGHLVAGYVTWGNSNLSSLSSITDDKSNTYTIVDKVATTAHNQSWASFYCANITNAPTVITATFVSLVATGLLMTIDEWSGLATASPLDGHAMQNQITPATSTDAITSGSITTTVNGDLIYGGSTDASPGGDTLSDGTGFTALVTDTTFGDNTNTEYLIQSSAGSIAATFTVATSPNAIITGVMAFKPAGGNSITMSKGAWAFTGKSETPQDLFTMSKIGWAFTGKSITPQNLFAMAKTAFVYTGHAFTLPSNAVQLFKAAWAFTGKSITPQTFFSVSKASFAYTGKTLSPTNLFNVAKGAWGTWAGKTLAPLSTFSFNRTSFSYTGRAFTFSGQVIVTATYKFMRGVLRGVVTVLNTLRSQA